MKRISSLSTIIQSYDAILMDLWGVIHDGTNLYPGALESLQQLKAAGKQVICVSNAPRRSHKAVAVLERLGVPGDCYITVVTSGETAYHALQEGKINVGRRYYFIGPERDADVLDGLDYRAVEEVADADFLLNVGFGSEQDTVEDVTDDLREAADMVLPMLCLNPDMEVIKITGERFPCAGVIAKQYEEMGGEVTYYGKPYKDIYQRSMLLLGRVDAAQVLAIGDGLHTDIEGANRFGADSILVTGGILKGRDDITFDPDNSPTYLMDELRW